MNNKMGRDWSWVHRFFIVFLVYASVRVMSNAKKLSLDLRWVRVVIKVLGYVCQCAKLCVVYKREVLIQNVRSFNFFFFLSSGLGLRLGLVLRVGIGLDFELGVYLESLCHCTVL
ncbi:hypothetical protein T492DRAFT_341094 [Pavlovales sp. CCMP2436]|nr:hypothetical protein T492DRAFT_341094 [Pavlovales sp. CCMP2436]